MKRPLTDALLDRIAERFRALAEPARLRILRRLLEGEAAVGELARSAKLSQANTSKHLALLLAARFVARRADGTSAVYRIDDPSIAKMCEVACDGFAARVAADAKTMKPR
jgi:DNA-binding transcriptional ArsR family regulator